MQIYTWIWCTFYNYGKASLRTKWYAEICTYVSVWTDRVTEIYTVCIWNIKIVIYLSRDESVVSDTGKVQKIA